MASGQPKIFPPHHPPPRTPSPPFIFETYHHSPDEQSQPQQHHPQQADDGGGFLSPNSFLRVPSASRKLLRPPNGIDSNDMSSGDAQADDGNPVGPAPASPFNFQTQFISTSPVKSNIGQRRGHRYKHSSISAQHQIFQEPPPRPPPVLPASLPIPTFREAWSSMHRDQRARLYWCLCHAAVAVYVFFSASGSLAMTALSHLVFFDVGSAAICVCVDVLGNFEVWRRSSVRHPFGLQRTEVLAGFAMSVFLVFGGFDLLSHNMKHALESVGGDDHHHQTGQAHGHSHGHGHGHGLDERVSPGAVDTASLAAIVATLVSAYGLMNHSRIQRVMRVTYPAYLASFLPGVLSNPFHFLTLFFSFLMLLLPLLSIRTFVWLDSLICAAIAVSMFVLGFRLAIAQGMMLLMSYRGGPAAAASAAPYPSNKANGDPVTTASRGARGGRGASGENASVSAVVREIESEPIITRVEEAQFWQVHYGLCMANLKLRVVKGCDDSALSQLRGRVARVIQNRLGEGYGRGGSLRWEVTLQMSSDSRS